MAPHVKPTITNLAFKMGSDFKSTTQSGPIIRTCWTICKGENHPLTAAVILYYSLSGLPCCNVLILDIVGSPSTLRAALIVFPCSSDQLLLEVRKSMGKLRGDGAFSIAVSKFWEPCYCRPIQCPFLKAILKPHLFSLAFKTQYQSLIRLYCLSCLIPFIVLCSYVLTWWTALWYFVLNMGVPNWAKTKKNKWHESLFLMKRVSFLHPSIH